MLILLETISREDRTYLLQIPTSNISIKKLYTNKVQNWSRQPRTYMGKDVIQHVLLISTIKSNHQQYILRYQQPVQDIQGYAIEHSEVVNYLKHIILKVQIWLLKRLILYKSSIILDMENYCISRNESMEQIIEI